MATGLSIIGNMTIIGLDVGRNHAVAAALDHYPMNLKRYYNAHRRDFVRINFDSEGLISFWKEAPNGTLVRVIPCYVSLRVADSGNLKKKFHGSKVCCSHLYMWAKVQFDMNRGKLMESGQGKALWEKHQQLRKLYKNNKGKWENGDDAIGGDDAIIRTLFATTTQLYKNLKQELID